MSSQLARKYALDVAPYVNGTAPSDASIVWTKFKGITDFQPDFNPTMVDASDYDTNGWTSQEKTMMSGVLTAKCRRPTDGGVYDPGQEIVRAAQLKFSDSARVFARYYDRFGSAEARAGLFLVEWNQTKTGVADLEEATAKLSSDGPVVDLASNPYVPNAVPSINAVTPANKGAGQIVTIIGQGFTGTTSVKFAGTSAADYRVMSDSAISAVLPAGTAGAAAVAVTNANGTSANFNYTRAA